MTFWTKGTQRDPYGCIETIKIKIGDIHSKMEVSGRFAAVWPIVRRGGGGGAAAAAAFVKKMGAVMLAVLVVLCTTSRHH